MATSGLACLACHRKLFATEEIFFFVKGSKDVHLSIKPEHKAFATEKVELRPLAKGGNSKKNFIKSDVACHHCKSSLGKELAAGPSSTHVISFGSDKVCIDGIQLGPKEKWWEAYPRFSNVQQRGETNYHIIVNDDGVPDDGSGGGWKSRLAAQVASKPTAPIRFASPSVPEEFSWEGCVVKTPRDYQIKAYLEALLQDIVLVAETGAGKTLVAAMLIYRMKALNRDKMALFLVERVPLVFQQGQAIAVETGLSVCRMCSETKTPTLVRQLHGGRFDVLVATAGSLVDLIRNGLIRLDHFCVCVVDEAHHATGDHKYMPVLDAIRLLPPTNRPRLLGLTASPFAAENFAKADNARLKLSSYYCDALIYRPLDIPRPSHEEEVKIAQLSDAEFRFLTGVVRKIQELAAQIVEGGLDMIDQRMLTFGELVTRLGGMGQARGKIRGVCDDARRQSQNDILALGQSILVLMGVVEIGTVLGAHYGLQELKSHYRDKSLYTRLSDEYVLSRADGVGHDSDRLRILMELLHSAGPGAKILVFVLTRSLARTLLKVVGEREVGKAYAPMMVVGHGGEDGMQWEDEQETALESFREGKTRLLVCTSVLEEGLDVPDCNLVIRFDGVNSLISLVQSRGRARKMNSKTVVIASEEGKFQLEKIQSQNRFMAMYLNKLAEEQHLPSAQARSLLRQLGGSDSTQPTPPPERLIGYDVRDFVVEVHVRLANQNQPGSSSTNQIDSQILVDTLSRVAEGIKIQSIEAIGCGTRGVNGCYGDNIHLLNLRISKSTARTVPNVVHGYAELCSYWDFRSNQSSGLTMWWLPRMSSQLLHVQAGNRFPHGKPWKLAKATLGVLTTPTTFEEQTAIPEPLALTLYPRGSLDVSFSYASARYIMRIPTNQIAGFIVISSESSSATPFFRVCVPLSSPAFLFSEKENRDGDLVEERNLSGPIFSQVSTAAAICFSVPTTRQSLVCDWLGLHQAFTNHAAVPVPLFDTRISVATAARHSPVFDWSKPLWVDLPGYNSDSAIGREIWWALSAFYATAAFSPQAASEKVLHKVRFQVQTAAGDQSKLAVIAAALYETRRRLECNYWSDSAAEFEHLQEALSSLSAPSVSMPPNHVSVPRVIITPSRTIPLPSVATECSRMLREAIATPGASLTVVTFREEQFQKISGTYARDRVREILTNGFVVHDKTYRFLNASNSMVRNQSALFVHVGNGQSDDVSLLRHRIVRAVDEADVEVFSGSTSQETAKARSRLALFCTADKPTIEIPTTEVVKVADIRTFSGQDLLTDGAAKVSYTTAQQISTALGLGYVPSAFQYRWAGCKGVALVVDPSTDPDMRRYGPGVKMVYRESTEKLQSRHVVFGVVGVSRPTKVSLNREIITLLSSLAEKGNSESQSQIGTWSPDGALADLQERALSDALTLLVEGGKAYEHVRPMVPLPLRSVLDVAVQSGIDILGEPFLFSLVQTAYHRAVRGLVAKTWIPVPDSVMLLAVPDPIGCLNDGEIFASIDYTHEAPVGERGGSFILASVTSQCMVYRNPCLHPGDVQVVRVVDRPELRAYKNVVIVPASSVIRSSLLAACSGGDLDGDKLSLIWDKRLIPPERYRHSPLNYAQVQEQARQLFETRPLNPLALMHDDVFWANFLDPCSWTGSDDESSLAGSMGSDDELSLVHSTERNLGQYISKAMDSDLLGRVASMHLALCDMLEGGATNQIALTVAEAQSVAVDSLKTGIAPMVPVQALQLIEIKGYPDFMEKADKDSYTSGKILGELYRRAKGYDAAAELRAEVVSAAKVHRVFQRPGARRFMAPARTAHVQYCVEIAQAVSIYGADHESELLIGWCPALHPLMAANRGRAFEGMQQAAASVWQHHREIFQQIVAGVTKGQPTNDDWLDAASAWYQAAYTPSSQGKLAPITGSESCLGFAWIPGDHLAAMSAGANQSRPICPLGTVQDSIGRTSQRYFVDHVAGLQRGVEEKLQLAEQVYAHLQSANLIGPFLPHIYGSAALFTCDESSDLDLCLRPQPAAMQPPYAPAGKILLATDRNLRQHWLEYQIVPALEGLAVSINRSAVKAPTPVIRCCLATAEGATEALNMDVTVCTDGVDKCRFILGLYLARPEMFLAVWVATRWARLVGVLPMAPSEQETIRDADLMRNTEIGLLNSGQWQLLLLHVIQSGTTAGLVDPNRAVRLDDNTNTPEGLRLVLAGLLDRLQETATTSYSHTGQLVCAVFRGLSSLPAGSLSLTWPYQNGPTVTIDEDQVRAVCEHARRMWHALAATRDVTEAMRLADSTNQNADYERCLSGPLSRRIAGTTDFYELRLARLTGAEISLVEVLGRGRIKIRARGPATAINRVREELLRLEDGVSKFGPPPTNANKYFMEGATLLLAENAVDADARLEFTEHVTAFHLHHVGHTMHNCALVAQPSDIDVGFWKQAARSRFVAAFVLQMEKFPFSSASHCDSLQIKAKFGRFYVLDAERALRETSSTMSVGELQEALIRKGRKVTQRILQKKRDAREEGETGGTGGGHDRKGLAELQPGMGGVATRTPKTSVQLRARKTPGAFSTFISGFLPENKPVDTSIRSLIQIYHATLLSAGFCQSSQVSQSNQHETYKVSLAGTRNVEICMKMNASLDVIGYSERALRWVSATVIGHDSGNGTRRNVVVDSRLMVQTCDPLPPGMIETLPHTPGPVRTITSPIEIDSRTHRPIPIKDAREAKRCTVFHVRHITMRETWIGPMNVRATIRTGQDYEARDLKENRCFCEISLDFDGILLTQAMTHGLKRAQAQAYAGEVFDVVMGLADRLKEKLSGTPGGM